MKVLFVEDVPGTAYSGDIKDVKNGFARNYLLPRKLAVLATPDQMNRVAGLQAAASKRRESTESDMAALAETLEGATITIEGRAGRNDRLYGSITNLMVAEEISKVAGREIDRRRVVLEPIRQLGTYEVPVKLYQGIEPKVTVVVTAPGREPVVRAGEAAAEATDETVAVADQEPVAEAPDETVAEADQEPVAEAPDETVAVADQEPVAEAPDETVAEADQEPVAEAPDETVAEADQEPVTGGPGRGRRRGRSKAGSGSPKEAVAVADQEPAAEAPEEVVAEADQEPVTEGPGRGRRRGRSKAGSGGPKEAVAVAHQEPAAEAPEEVVAEADQEPVTEGPGRGRRRGRPRAGNGGPEEAVAEAPSADEEQDKPSE